MVTTSRPRRLPLGPVIAIVGGILIAAMFLAVPDRVLEGAVQTSRLPVVLAAAEPPLGVTARIALALLMGGGFALCAWFGLRPGLRHWAIPLGGGVGSGVDKAADLIRRRDIHPDAPPRPPLSATQELGTPFLEVTAPEPVADEPLELAEPLEPAGPVAEAESEAEVFADAAPDAPSLETTVVDTASPAQPAVRSVFYSLAEPEPDARTLPADLDQPMAGYDPSALRDEPLTPSEPLPPLTRPALIDPGDRMETFEITPVTRPARAAAATTAGVAARAVPIGPLSPPDEAAGSADESAPTVAPETEATVQELLARLERGLANGDVPVPPKSLRDSLRDLRNLAGGD